MAHVRWLKYRLGFDDGLDMNHTNLTPGLIFIIPCRRGVRLLYHYPNCILHDGKNSSLGVIQPAVCRLLE